MKVSQMAKYYVECGDIKDVFNANSPMEACVFSVISKMKIMDNCNLKKMFVVSEKGFVSDRFPLVIDTSSEHFLDLETVFQELDKQE
jgi:hypothetical protein